MSKSANVWVVMIGENYEGGSVYGVFHKRANARAWVAQNHPNFRLNKEQTRGSIRYQDGCDWLTIRKHEIQ